MNKADSKTDSKTDSKADSKAERAVRVSVAKNNELRIRRFVSDRTYHWKALKEKTGNQV